MQRSTVNIFDLVADNEAATARFVELAHARLPGEDTNDLEMLVALLIEARGESFARGLLTMAL